MWFSPSLGFHVKTLMYYVCVITICSLYVCMINTSFRKGFIVYLLLVIQQDVWILLDDN
jgi:hypothetical protein